MREEYDFSKAKRAKDIPHLAKLQAEAKGKTPVVIMLDDDLLDNFQIQAKQRGIEYQTLINKILRASIDSSVLTEDLLRKVVREELNLYKTAR
ncbi:hypothetical protein TI05_04060 [Achromatium sp. WMS3]|nr:hypothetical protein TI05_04060 [Achromatium sp. WMS3]